MRVNNQKVLTTKPCCPWPSNELVPPSLLSCYVLPDRLDLWTVSTFWLINCKVKRKEDSLDSIPSPSTSVKIQIMGGKLCLRCWGKTLLGIVNKVSAFKSLLITPSNVLLLHPKQTFTPMIWIFTEVEGDGIESRLSS